MIGESNYVIAITTFSDWLKRVLIVYKNHHSKDN